MGSRSSVGRQVGGAHQEHAHCNCDACSAPCCPTRAKQSGPDVAREAPGITAGRVQVNAETLERAAVAICAGEPGSTSAAGAAIVVWQPSTALSQGMGVWAEACVCGAYI